MAHYKATLSNAAIAEIELRYVPKISPSKLPQIRQSSDAYEIFLAHWNKEQLCMREQMKVMLLNRANKVLGIFEVSTGGITGTVGDPRLIFACALVANACAMILCHNHPSGNLKPSQADRDLTTKLVEGGKLLDISILDHLIICDDSYYSFADTEGL